MKLRLTINLNQDFLIRCLANFLSTEWLIQEPLNKRSFIKELERHIGVVCRAEACPITLKSRHALQDAEGIFEEWFVKRPKRKKK
jgi:hypothetical protein